MPWVPIADSGLAYSFNQIGLATLVGSTVVANELAGPSDSSWEIYNDTGEPMQFRITVQSYTGTPSGGPDQSDVAFFFWDGGTGNVANQAADPNVAFEPTQIEGTVNAAPGSGFFYNGAAGSEWSVIETYQFLVEVWVESAPSVSYNCECDEVTRNAQSMQSLLQRMAIRMGYGAQATRLPPAKAAEFKDYLQEAQRFLFDKVASFRESRYFKWPLQQGVRFYDYAENSDECTKKFVPELVEWVGISYGDDETDEVWTPLIKGIPPELYTGGIPESLPYRYDFRQCIELWPAPDDRAGFLRVRAKFDLLPFEDEGDLTTIDGDLVFMLALGNAKNDRQNGSGQADIGRVMSRMGDLIAASHLTARYIPGDVVWREPPEPRLVGGYLPSA